VTEMSVNTQKSLMAFNSAQKTLSGTEIPVLGYGVSVGILLSTMLVVAVFAAHISNHFQSFVHGLSLTSILGLRSVRYVSQDKLDVCTDILDRVVKLKK
jgi:hypothetical protein